MPAFDTELPASAEREETINNTFMLGYPVGRFGETRAVYMDSVSSFATFSDVCGAVAMAGAKRHVIEQVADTRLDFARIVEGLEG
jgi:hypothetical protein